MKKAAIWMMGALVAMSVTAFATGTDPNAKPAAPPASMKHEKLQEVSATVTSLDQATRMVGLKADDGSTSAFEVGPEVKNLAQVHVGDKVVVSYYRGIAAQVNPAATATNKVNQVDLATQAQPGQAPMAGAGSAIQATVVIEKVDVKANTVTFKRPDGLSRTVTVESKEGKDFLKKIKKGDKVDVVYAEAVAIEVRKAT